MSNHYETLGISKDATEKEIKQAYRALSMKYHPDKTSAEDAVDKMKQINEAYSVLSDPEQRQQYDNPIHQAPFGHGQSPFGHGQGPFGPGFPPGLFEMLFSQGGGPEVHFFHSLAKPPPLIKPVEITFAQSFSGTTIDVNSQQVHIPAGINDGNSIILSEQGLSANGVKGDLHLQIRISNNTPFTRQGNNLVFKHKVSLKEALCGFKFHIDHLNGNKLSLNMNAIVYPGAKQVIKNLGFPGISREQNSVGDMVIEFEIEFPEHLSQEQKETLANVLL